MKVPTAVAAARSLASPAAAETRREAPHVAPAIVREVAPALAEYTDAVLFDDLWRGSDLSPRDRSLVTIVALIADGQVEQLPFHLARGLDNGLTRAEVAGAITHLAFYAGWPKAMSAVMVAKAVFDARAEPEGARKETVSMEILRQGAEPAMSGPAEYFTGTVTITSRFQRAAPARIGGAVVSFAPGARTAWHTHPLGQTLVVTAGVERVQCQGGPIEEIRPGDVVWIPPGIKHWHGAAPTSAMTHVAVAEALDGRSVDWLEPVSDAQYAAAGS